MRVKFGDLAGQSVELVCLESVLPTIQSHIYVKVRKGFSSDILA
jgi:hypothetical protein